MLTASISIALSGSLFLFFLFVILFVVISVLFYLYTLPPIPRSLRIILSGLRSLSLVLLLFLLFEPVLRYVTSKEQPPSVAILVDNSRSMTIHGTISDHAKLAETITGRKLLDGISLDIEQNYYLFDSDVKGLDDNIKDSLLFLGEQTDIDRVLLKLKEDIQKNNVRAAFLISDGNYTTGKNPVHEAEALGIPIYTIGVGDTNEQKDILIQKVATNAVVYAESRVPVDVTVMGSGIENQTVEVTISDGRTVIGNEIVNINRQTRSYPVKFYVEPKQEGVNKYTVRVSKIPGEITDKNNSSTFFIKALKRKLNIVIIGGGPSPDLSAVRQIIESDQHYTVASYVQKRAGEYYEGQIRGQQIDSTDCFVFVGFPSRMTGAESVQFLKEFIDQKRIPILFINQRLVDYSKLQPFLPLLPFTWAGSPAGEVMVTPSVPEGRRTHPLIILDGAMNAESWMRLPPIYKSPITFHLKPEAELIVSSKLQNISLEEPLIATRNINGQKTLAVAGYGIWRWRLLTQGSGETEQLLSRFIMSAIQWLTTSDSRDAVRLRTIKDAFTTAEPVEFSGEVYDERMVPVDGAEFTIEAQKGEERFSAELKSIGNGRYEGSIGEVPEGDYRFTGKAVIHGRLLGETKGRFMVGEVNAEFLETRMNKNLLEQISYRSGGAYFSADEAENLIGMVKKQVSFTAWKVSSTSETELWNWKYLGVIIVCLLALEWFLRKRNGML
jgi:hypothetical protein